MTIEEIKKSEKETELTINFGKNGNGLTDELTEIGKKINELSKTNRVCLRDSFIDEIDDVYMLKFVIFSE